MLERFLGWEGMDLRPLSSMRFLLLSCWSLQITRRADDARATLVRQVLHRDFVSMELWLILLHSSPEKIVLPVADVRLEPQLGRGHQKERWIARVSYQSVLFYRTFKVVRFLMLLILDLWSGWWCLIDFRLRSWRCYTTGLNLDRLFIQPATSWTI